MIRRVRAPNPSPLTLSGTNSYVVDGAWVIDPGPSLPAHLEALAAAVSSPAGILLTHDHADHSEAAPELAERLGVPVVEASGGERIGPFDVLAVPGHADDHVVFVAGRDAFTGDAVLGEGSVFVQSRLREYLGGLARLRALDLELLCPGHGEPVTEPNARLDELIAHRHAREEALVAALDRGLRTEDELLAAAWADAPRALRSGAALSLAAHLGKLREEGRLPDGVEVTERDLGDAEI
jgi:glyoxylase-like metal-dependent hydrolase (beta-lactamase superfamily II)